MALTCPQAALAPLATFSMSVADRIEVYGEARAFITLKDHKENFENAPKCRLINPAKTNIGKISKQILQKSTGK